MVSLSPSTQAADGTPPLTGVRVVEVCDSIAVAHCGKLLAHMGAEVTKVEPPEGDPARGHGAFPGGAPHDETSALFLHLNANKRSATLAVGSATGRAILDRLAAASDVLVYDTPELSDPAAGVDGLVRVAITPFGLDGPNAGYRASDLTSFAAGGEAYTLPGNLSYELFPERGPVRAGGYLAEHDAGVLGALAALSALLSRSRNGSGERVDLSKQEASMAMARETLQRFAGYDELIDWRRTYFFGGIFPAADGHVVLFPREDRHWAALCDAMDRPDLAADPRFATFDERRAHRPELNAVMRAWAAGLEKRTIYHAVASRGCPAALFGDARDVAASPQLRARGFFQRAAHPKAGALEYTAQAFRLSRTPPAQPRGAPLLGEHNAEVYCDELGYSRRDLTGLRRAGVV